MGKLSCPCQEFYFPMLSSLPRMPSPHETHKKIALRSLLYLESSIDWWLVFRSGHLLESLILLFWFVIASDNFPIFFIFLFKRLLLGVPGWFSWLYVSFLTLAQVTILGFVGSSPASSSALTVRSLLGILSLSLSLCSHPCSCSLSLKINKHFKINFLPCFTTQHLMKDGGD